MKRNYKKYLSQLVITLFALILFVSFANTNNALSADNAGSLVAFPINQYENIARGKPYTLQPKPNYTLTADTNGSTKLTDGAYTVGYFWTQKSTVGWQSSRPIIITIDLGKVEPICGVSYNTAAGIAGVTWPVSISVLVSDDGKNYCAVGDLVTMSKKHGVPPVQGYAVFRYWTDELKTYGRYVQLIIDSGGFFSFTDEVEVYQGKPECLTVPMSNKPTAGALEYFKNKVSNDWIRTRLNLDLEEAKKAINSSDVNEKETVSLLRELLDIETQIKNLPYVDTLSIRNVMPLNDIEKSIFAVQGKLRSLQGSPVLEAWVSHPYDYLTPTQGPENNARDKIDVSMMRGEWRYAVINLTNSSERSVTEHVHIDGLPGGVNPDFITVYQVEWTATKEQKPIAAALVEAQRDKDGYSITIPAGMVRQVWFSLHPVNVPSGNYKGQVVVTRASDKPLSVPMTLQLFPMIFPQQPTLHLGGWDYTDGIQKDVTEANRSMLVAHLQQRFVDSPWGTSSVLARGEFDALGNMTAPSTQRFDKWVELWPHARRYCVFVDARESLAGAEIGTPEFNARVKSWIDYWVNHAGLIGIEPEKLILLLLDEPSENKQDKVIIAWAKAIREAQPRVVLWEDIYYKKPQQAMPETLSSVDVLSPNRSHFLEGGVEIEDFYKKQRALGRRLDIYSSSGPMHLLDPYSYVRLQAWTCWVMGAESTYFWSLSDTGGGSPWQPYIPSRNNYAPIFLTQDSVTPGKHMEAMRESVEDYEYFEMLQMAVASANPNNPAIPRAKKLLLNGAHRVLDAPGVNKISWFDQKDRWRAEEVRLEILRTLMELR